jgi:Virulence factor membrane-bound polymerase, C-terminal/O-Antigen ligase/Protein glycosylation ligase
LPALRILKNFLTPAAAKSAPMSPFWLGLWALALAVGWVLPNHYPPWPNFHSDLWVAGAVALAGGAVLSRSQTVIWHRITVLVMMTASLPLLQFLAGFLPFAGQAWTPFLYLLGFAIALLIGAQWERMAPQQVVDGLFLAIGLAAIASVGIQLEQWLVSRGISIWVLPNLTPRPHANFGQPNLLATFLIWGLCACAWAVLRHKIRWPVALLMSTFLLLGIALTQSRTAIVTLVVVALVCLLRRNRWSVAVIPWVLAALVAACVLLLSSLDGLNAWLLLDNETGSLLTKTRNETRVGAYRLFIDAAMQRPWFGYGWTELGGAQLAVADQHAALGGFFFHSHNLFLDLVLWVGVPVGLLISAALIYWFCRRIGEIRQLEDAILMVFVGSVAWHAMTELPLHYASFLLPTGLVMGVLNMRHAKVVAITRVWWPALIWGGALVLLVLMARDYFRVEANFYALRFERARLSEKPPLSAPEVVLLTDLREYLRLARFKPESGLSEEVVDWVRDAANAQPSEASLFTLITVLTLNHHEEEARRWISKTARVTSKEVFAHLKAVWAYEVSRNPALGVVQWSE